jgi:hypothetical protein
MNTGKLVFVLSGMCHWISPMENIMHIIHITSKGKMIDTLENFYIYRETLANNQINDKLTVHNTAVFKTLVCEDSYRDFGPA